MALLSRLVAAGIFLVSSCAPASSPTPTAVITPVPTPAPTVVSTTIATPTPQASEATPAPPLTPIPERAAVSTTTATLTPQASRATPAPLLTPTPEPSEPSKPSGDGPNVPSASFGDNRSRLAVVLDNQWVFIRNGGLVNLGKGLSVELSLDPYPPTGLRAFLNMHVTLNGTPVSGGEADMTYDMRGMVHGPFKSSAKNMGNGRYLFAIDHTEFGAWEHHVTIYTPEDHPEITVGIVALP